MLGSTSKTTESLPAAGGRGGRFSISLYRSNNLLYVSSSKSIERISPVSESIKDSGVQSNPWIWAISRSSTNSLNNFANFAIAESVSGNREKFGTFSYSNKTFISLNLLFKAEIFSGNLDTNSPSGLLPE